jgi:hypothetical protein
MLNENANNYTENVLKILENLNMKATAESFRKEFNSI